MTFPIYFYFQPVTCKKENSIDQWQTKYVFIFLKKCFNCKNKNLYCTKSFFSVLKSFIHCEKSIFIFLKSFFFHWKKYFIFEKRCSAFHFWKIHLHLRKNDKSVLYLMDITWWNGLNWPSFCERIELLLSSTTNKTIFKGL